MIDRRVEADASGRLACATLTSEHLIEETKMLCPLWTHSAKTGAILKPSGTGEIAGSTQRRAHKTH